MQPSHPIVRQLLQEVRSCQGIERTPAELVRVLQRRFRFPLDSARKILADRDRIQQFAFSLRFGWQDGLPSSADLMDHRWR